MAYPLFNTPVWLPPISEKPSEPIVRPDIEWIPSYKTFKNRVASLAALNLDRPTTVPEGWPTKLDAERCWNGADLTEADYVVKFTPEDIVEIEAALAHFKALPDLTPDDVNKTTFPLPVLGPRLHEVAKTIHYGRGFVVLRGLTPSKYSNMDNILLYLGVTSYIAETRGMQDFDGRMILHIQAVADETTQNAINSPYVARAQPFHSDLCDVLSLYALNAASSGGDSFLASTAAIYNHLAATRPDILHVLAAPDWPFDEFFENQHHHRPLLHLFPASPDPSSSRAGGGPVFQFSRRPLTGAPFSPHHPLVPALTELQAEALDAVHFAAQAVAVCIALQPGDMEVFNNFAMLHARSRFVDEGAQRRHMLRLWLRNDEMRWTLPKEGKGAEVLERLSWECYGEHEWRRGRVWDIEASPVELRVKHRRASCA